MRPIKRKKNWYLVAIIFILALVFFLSRSFWLKVVGGLSSPMYKFGIYISDIFQSDDQLKTELESLRQDLKATSVDYALLQSLVKENEELRSLLNYTISPEYKKITAEIISVVPGLDKSIFLINKGNKQGILPGMPVISPDGILIGKVYRSDEYTSQIVFLENALFKVTAQIQNDEQTMGLVVGVRNLGIRINYLPQTENINLGDLVVTSGRDQYIPRGLVIGKISTIHKNENDFFQSATIISPEDFQKVFFVGVLVPSYE